MSEMDIPDDASDSGSSTMMDVDSPLSPNTAESSSSIAVTRRRSRTVDQKTCGVCGDRALGYNFDAISCESCKAFFRRNAPKPLDYFKCPYDNNCNMDVLNRRFCKRCRLRKCFEIGMRKEYILSDDEKRRKRKLIEQNRVQRDIDRDQQEVVRVHGERQRVLRDNPKLQLTESDWQEIVEVLSAYRDSLRISVQSKQSADASNIIDLVNIAEVSVRRVIDMAKRVTMFRELPREDQTALLKSGSVELLVLRSVLTFDKEKQIFLDPCDGEDAAMSAEQLRKAESAQQDISGDLFSLHIDYVKSFVVDLEADETSLILLLVICLLSPDRPGLSNPVLVSSSQEHYAMLLQKYLFVKCSPADAQLMYPKLLGRLTQLRSVAEGFEKLLNQAHSLPTGIQPLMKEVLNIRENSPDLSP